MVMLSPPTHRVGGPSKVTPPSQQSCSEQRRLGGGVAGGPGRRRGKPVGRYRLVDCWSRAEWERRPAEARPEGAVPFGDCWLLLTEESPDGSSGTRAEPPASEPGGELRTDGSHRGGGVMPGDDAVPTVRRPVVILNALGLHLRPAGLFVGLARRFAAEIRVHRDGLCVDGKSILDLAMLAAGCGTRLELEARGPEEKVLLLGISFHPRLTRNPSRSISGRATFIAFTSPRLHQPVHT